MIKDWEKLFSFDHQQIEQKIQPRFYNYQGLQVEALYTSLIDLEMILTDEAVSGTFVDLGAGVGRTCLMYGLLHPDRVAIGIESEAPRLEAGLKLKQQLALDNVELIKADLLHCPIPEAETYFLYFPTGPVLDRVLSELRHCGRQIKLVAIESHGDLLARLAKEHWLNCIKTIPLKSPRHYPEALVFSGQGKLCLNHANPHELSFRNKYLLIQDADNQEWVGESYGLEWEGKEQYHLLVPPRTVQWSQVKAVKSLTDFPPEIQQVLNLRRLGEMRINYLEQECNCHLRKIITSPSFKLEFSDGAQVEWGDIKSIHQGHFLCYESSSGFFSLPPAPTM